MNYCKMLNFMIHELDNNEMTNIISKRLFYYYH